MSAAQAAVLDLIYPDWRATHNGVWYTRLEAVESFFASHGRFPRAKTDDATEKSAGIWLATQRQTMDSISAQRTMKLDEELPSWRQSRDDIWTEHLRSTASYLREHGYFPRSSSDPSVRRMASWMSSQRNLAGSMPPRRLSALDEHIPEWRNRTASIWRRKLDQVASRLAASGHLPRQASGDPEEAKLAFWLAYQRTHAGKLTDEQVHSLNDHAPGWSGQSNAQET